MAKRSRLIDKHGEVRELTTADFARMRPAHKVLPKIMGAKLATEMLKRRGRPKSASPKTPINLRLDSLVLTRWKASGAGWQTRMAQALRRAAP